VAYLDHAATSPLWDEARDAMLPYLGDRFGNPSGAHAAARAARTAIDEARDVLAEVLGCAPGEVVFTSGGTEADNAAVFGVHRRHGGVVVCSAIEHHAVLDPVRSLDGRLVPVDADGVIDLDALAATLDPSVSLVSVMAANNEVGSIQPLAAVREVMADRAPAALLHTDAVQAFCWLDVAEATAPADLISVSAHKFGGPKGVGVLVVRRGVTLDPLLLGGGQEQDRRSGTPNVPGIVGMATAARLTADDRKTTVDRVAARRDRLIDGLLATVEGAMESGDRAAKVAAIAHLCFEGVDSESLLFLLDRAGIAATAASSCASGAQAPSHVLEAMGISRDLARGSLRLSLGRTTTDEDVDAALAVIPPAVERLRQFG
jgi:cysteine desulfurase